MFWQGDIRHYFSCSKDSFGRRVTPSPSAWACFAACFSSRLWSARAVGFKCSSLVPTQDEWRSCFVPGRASFLCPGDMPPQLARSVGSLLGAGAVILLTQCAARGLKLFAFFAICRRVALTLVPSFSPFTSPSVPLNAGGPALWWMAWFVCHTIDTNVHCSFKSECWTGMSVWMDPSTPPSLAFQDYWCLGCLGGFSVLLSVEMNRIMWF